MHMVKLHLVEEALLAGPRIPDNGSAALLDPDIVAARPLALCTSIAARLLDRCPVLCAEEALPAHVQTFGEVTDIHKTFVLKLLSNRWIEALINFPAVYDWRRPALLRDYRAKEVD